MLCKRTLAACVLVIASSAAIDIPANIKTFYNNLQAQGQCQSPFVSGLYSWYGGPADWSYCGDHWEDWGIIYIQGKNGLLCNMDIDCDGQSREPNSGRCGHNPTDQSMTAMRDYIQAYQIPGITDLNTYIHPYVVFGNSGENTNNVNFDPRDHGVQALSIIMVVTPTTLTCGIWGDTNGGERDASYVGEAALAMGELTFGNEVNGTVSHEPNDVLYIAFKGQDAVPGKTGANWAADTKQSFAASINDQCLRLVSRIQPQNGGGDGGSCSWQGHCAGAPCKSKDECSDNLTCVSGKCVLPQDCSWAGHCTGAACKSGDDCGDDLVCKGGKCGKPTKLRFTN